MDEEKNTFLQEFSLVRNVRFETLNNLSNISNLKNVSIS